MVHKWYIHLEFHFCTFYDFKNLTFTACNCCISILPNHSRCLTVWQVWSLWSQPPEVRPRWKASLLPAAQPMHQHESAISHTLPQTKGWLNLFFGVQKIKRTRMKPPWKGPFCIKIDSGPRNLKPSTLHMFWRELKHFATKALLWCSWEPIVFLMLVYFFTLWSCWSKLLADSGAVQPRNQINQRGNSWRRTFPDSHSMRSIWFKLDFELAWHQLLATDTRGC